MRPLEMRGCGGLLRAHRIRALTATKTEIRIYDIFLKLNFGFGREISGVADEA